MTTLDAYLDALSDVKRRRLLVALAESNPQSIDHTHAEQPWTQQHQIEMYHVHLPKLAEMDLVDWDRDADRITKGTQFEEIEPLIQSLKQVTATCPER